MKYTEEGINEAEYIKGYNNGWLIAEHEPTLATELRESLQLINDFESGLFHGINGHSLEQEAKRTSELNEIRTDINQEQEISQDNVIEEAQEIETENDIENDRIDELNELQNDSQEKDVDLDIEE